MLKIPVGLDLRNDYYYDDPALGVYAAEMPESLAYAGFDHFGDIDYYDGSLDCYRGLICVPIDGAYPGMAFYYSSPSGGEIEYLAAEFLLEQDSAGWCAFREEDDSLMVYTSNSTVDAEHPIRKYEVIASCTTERPFRVFLSPQPDLSLQGSQTGWNQLPWYEEDGRWELRHMQGGVFSRWGHLYLVNGYMADFDNYKGGIWVFRVEGNIATLVDHSTQAQDEGSFVFEFHTYEVGTIAEEPEGIDIWDLDNHAAPGIEGQIHVIMIDNYPFLTGKDDLYFKHYTTYISDKCKI